jgi:hypothetical protein
MPFPITFAATLTGANGNPSAGSSGTGVANVIIDQVLNTREVAVSFSGSTSGTTDGFLYLYSGEREWQRNHLQSGVPHLGLA